jgi:uncharacterized membrane protein YesL
MREGKGVSKDEKTPRLILFFQIFFRKFWNLIVINLLYFLFCLPIVTIGPATAGITKLMRNYAREEHAFIWGDFIETFKKNFKQSFVYSVVDLFVVAFLVFDFLAVGNIQNQAMSILCIAAILLTLTVWTFMRFYVYSMMVTFRLSFKQLLKNAFIFCWVGFLRNLFILAIIVVITIFVIYLNYIYQLFVFAAIYFSFQFYLINFMVYPLIKKYMIDGFDPETGERLQEEKYEGFDELK